MIEVITMARDYIGTEEERIGMEKADLRAGDTFYCWDSKSGYVYASGDWRLL